MAAKREARVQKRMEFGGGEALRRRAQELVSALKANSVTIVTAESCTAGAIAALLSQAEGASDVLQGGFIAYTKAQKTAALGVSERLLTQQGAVNAQVAKEMARGALERSPASLAVAVTGVLGPKPDEDGNPVGLVLFCALARYRKAEIVREDFGKRPHDELLHLVLARALDVIEHAVSACSKV